MRKLCLALVGVMAAACSSNNGPTNTSGIPDQCNPLGGSGSGCMLPWPSMAYIDTDSTTQTGFRWAPPIDAMPKNADKILIDPSHFGAWDGYSPTGPLIVHFATSVGSANLPGYMDPSASLGSDSPIVIINVDTGERLPFFAEVDANVPFDPTAQPPTVPDLIIRPLAREKPGSHYAVALRNTLVAPDGSPLPVPPAFAAMRDGTSFDHPLFAKISKNADQMFTAFAAAGVDKSEMVLAWDWVTASDQFLTSDLTKMLAAAGPAMGSNGSNLTFTTMPQSITGVYKAYLGTYKSPNFLTDGEMDDSIIIRDGSGGSGAPMLSGLRDANFAALIPSCVATHPLPRPLIIFGHGLFGSSASYITDSFTQSLAEQYCAIIVAGDFIGLTDRQIQLAPLAINDLNRGEQITEKLAQSIVDFTALETIARGPMATSAEFSYTGSDGTVTPVIDPTKVYYVGGSLGGIMGNVFMAYNRDITRGVLAVPGGDWSLLFERSNAWTLLQGAAMAAYPLEDYQLDIALLGMFFEPYDPVTTAAHVISDPMDGVPVKTILMWYAIGDCLVTNISTEVIAREMGIPLLAPATHVGWNMTPTPGPLTNGINILNAHPTPLPPTNNVPPPTDNGTHSGINSEPAALRMGSDFLLGDPQEVLQECHDGSGNPAPCDCATGACN